jgi:hypothetical protein
MARNGEPGLPRRREPDLAHLATFTLDPAGRVTSWSVTATGLFGHTASAVTGRHVCQVLMTGAGHRELVALALAEVAAGRVWSATVARSATAASPSAGNPSPGWAAAPW